VLRLTLVSYSVLPSKMAAGITSTIVRMPVRLVAKDRYSLNQIYNKTDETVVPGKVSSNH